MFNRQGRSSFDSKASMDALRLHLHSIIPPKPFFRLFIRPFRRKSAPSSPALPPKTYRSSSEGPADTVTVQTIRCKRIRVVKRRLKKRLDVYVHCRVHATRKRRSRVVDHCRNSVVSATNRDVAARHDAACASCMTLTLPQRRTEARNNK